MNGIERDTHNKKSGAKIENKIETRFSVILISFKSIELLSNALKSLVNSDLTNQDEILVVTNLSLEKTATIKFTAKANIKILYIESSGVNSKRNFGIKHSKGVYVYLMDDDTEISISKFFSQIENIFEKNLDLAAAGGFYKSSNDSSLATHSYNLMTKVWLFSQKKQIYLLGGFSIYKKAKIFGLYFDERIIYGAAEDSFNLRLSHSNNKTLIIESLYVNHNPCLNVYQLLKKAWRQGCHQPIFQRQSSLQTWVLIFYKEMSAYKIRMRFVIFLILASYHLINKLARVCSSFRKK
jgi:glycosyltransferase involved in cell wall biosynthesis